MSSYVYVFHAPRIGLYKIGRAKDLDRRFRTLQGAVPTLLVKDSWIYTHFAVWLEWDLHYRFRVCREMGEWFRLTPRHYRYLQLLMSRLPILYENLRNQAQFRIDLPSQSQLQNLRRAYWLWSHGQPAPARLFLNLRPMRAVDRLDGLTPSRSGRPSRLYR